jgi:hypothetical protein
MEFRKLLSYLFVILIFASTSVTLTSAKSDHTGQFVGKSALKIT